MPCATHPCLAQRTATAQLCNKYAPPHPRWADELNAAPGGAAAQRTGPPTGTFNAPATSGAAASEGVAPSAGGAAGHGFVCQCGMEAEMRTSNSAANPGRQYYKCSKPQRVGR